MVKYGSDSYVFDKRLPSERQTCDGAYKSLILLHEPTDKIRSRKHKRSAREGVNAHAVAEDIHYESGCKTDKELPQLIHLSGQYEQRQDVDTRINHPHKVEVVDQQNLQQIHYYKADYLFKPNHVR